VTGVQTCALPIFKNLDEINNLDNFQLKKIYLMLKFLEDSTFRNKIGEIIQKDISDGLPEHGGIVIFNNKHELFLKEYPTLSKNEETYLAPEEIFLRPSLAYFHLHSSNANESKFAGASSLDIMIAKANLELINKYDEFLISSLEKGLFNVDYYGGKNKKINKVDLGNYKYNLNQ